MSAPLFALYKPNIGAHTAHRRWRIPALCRPMLYWSFDLRARRWDGCTSHAMPMLATYNATIGAAKMHMKPYFPRAARELAYDA